MSTVCTNLIYGATDIFLYRVSGSFGLPYLGKKTEAQRGSWTSYPAPREQSQNSGLGLQPPNRSCVPANPCLTGWRPPPNWLLVCPPYLPGTGCVVDPTCHPSSGVLLRGNVFGIKGGQFFVLRTVPCNCRLSVTPHLREARAPLVAVTTPTACTHFQLSAGCHA